MFFPDLDDRLYFGGKDYQVVVDASSSEVFASIFPARGSTAYLAVAILGFLAFVAEGLVATMNLFLALVLMGITVVAVLASSLFVARRL